MSKIGIIFTAFNMEEYVHQSLAPWVESKDSKLLGHEFIISAVSLPFKEYKDIPVKNDDTTLILQAYKSFNHIQYLVTGPDFISEAEARTLALNPLLNDGCDFIWLVDADEEYSVENIANILKYIELERFISWFKVSLKNFVFDTKTYLKDPFTPPRIFKTQTNGCKLKNFHFDNDMTYEQVHVKGNHFVEDLISYKVLPSKTIPAKIAFVPHFSWISTEKSKQKTIYQEAHFGISVGGAGCSFAWDDKENKLIWNKEYFAKTNQQIPEIIKEI